MTYPPQGPYGYQVPHQVQPPPERPPQVLTAVILMFAVGFIGILMIFGSVLDAVQLTGVTGFGLAGCSGPVFHIAIGVLGIFVLRGQHGPRVAVFVVGGLAALSDGFSVVIGLVNASTGIAGYDNPRSGLLIFSSIVTALLTAAIIAVIVMLANGRVGAWFTAMGQRPPITPQQWS